MSPFSAKQTKAPGSVADLEAVWSARRSYWARKLGRIKLGVEPIEEQLSRYRRVTWMLTAVPAALSAVLFTLFTAFGRADIGAIVAALLFLPLVAGAWMGFFVLETRTRRYLAELHEFENARSRFQIDAAE